MPGKKTLVMFSEGFVSPETLDWQLQSTIDIANRANVAIYIIDASGLTGGTPTSGALVAASPLAGISGGIVWKVGERLEAARAFLTSPDRKG